MGRDVPAIAFTRQDRRAYREKVRRCLDAFQRMLRESKFDGESARIGLEIEFNLVDPHGNATMSNEDVLAAIGDPAWANELGQFNIELGAEPVTLAGEAFTSLESAIGGSLAYAVKRAQDCGSRLVMVGILPTLREADVSEHVISSNPRFKLLNDQIMAARGEEIRISIDGRDRLLAYVDHILPEAACTSVQCHLQVSPQEFASYWNAAQAIAGVQVAIGANAPYLLGRELWAETRLALFEQATDTRSDELRRQGVRPRVWFGEQWITSVADLFEENLKYFPALLPLCEDSDPMQDLDAGAVPDLAELTLHNGTIYRWNRPVYGVADGLPHLRIENRVLPAGPTVVDVLANAAFFCGLVHELASAERPIWSEMSFAAAAVNLTACARVGIGADVYWPGFGMISVAELTLRHLLPLAARGLDRWGVDSADASRLLATIEQRCLTGQNGASWQVRTVRQLEASGISDRSQALRLMTQGYIERMSSGEPVHSWPAM
jgi:hypothetical protein